ncbi:MAG: YegP family protein [Flavobacteriaceae bacterium]|nr:YegP family protein [Flavobacteriaceae bacterium]
MFELQFNEKANLWHFHLKAANGQIILSSQEYKQKDGALNGIESVKTNCGNNDMWERLTAKDNSPYFNLKAPNGQVIGTSQMYANEDGVEKGIASIKTNAPGAEVKDI